MTVGELIELLSRVDQNKTVYISCEGGCVIDDKISLNEEDQRVILEV